MLTGEQTEKLVARVTELLASDEEFNATLPSKDVAEAMLQPELGFASFIELVTAGYADRPALGQRRWELITEDGRSRRQLLPSFETISYAELWGRVTSIAAGLAGTVKEGDCVATLGFSSVDYTSVDMALPLLGAIAVPLHAGAPARHLQPIFDEVAPALIACSTEYLDVAVRLVVDGRARASILVFDHHAGVDDHEDALTSATAMLAVSPEPIHVETLATTIERGRTSPPPALPSADPERLAAIVYTSGSSGSPKGAMIPERLAKGAWCAIASTLVTRGFALPAITLNYLPMSHTGGRSMLYAALGAGGTAYFTAQSDMSAVLEDVALVRPTQLNFVPRVWELLHREYTSRVAAGGRAEDVLADMRRHVLGGRYISALTGSAPISAELAAWVEDLLDSHLMDALGATESGAVIVDGQLQRPPVTDYKLVDVPELGYFRTDRPHPRGELLIKSTTLFGGYYRRPELTAEVFDEDGYYRTGDVVAELGPDLLQYVDRRNNVLKLSNGEFVTVSKLETIYAGSELVRQIYVYGNSERSYLLAVVVPTDRAVADHDHAELATALLRSLRETAAEADLEPYEVPRDVIVEHEPFSVANGLLTGIRKPSRANLRARYGERLEELYALHASAEDARWQELTAQAAHVPTLETVCKAAGAVLGTADGDPAPDVHFTDLGGDSLSALSYASALSDLLGIEVPVGVVISPANDLRAVATHIEALRTSTSTQPTMASIHGTDAHVVQADDLRLDRFLDAATLEQLPPLPPTDAPRNVFLTGATGYLGRYLLIDWLGRAAAVGGTVTCLVRAKDDAAARRRLDDGFDSGDDELLARYRELAAEHLVVVAGDKGEERFGLEKDIWQHLAETVDVIVDPAALVNHVLPYPQLFGPNVVGTAEVIRLAITSRSKPVLHVSSIAVGAAVGGGGFTEDADVRQMSPSRPVESTYASGYATSKWAGEVLLREAHDLCGLPVAVFRCDMLMAEPRYRGQLNLPDLVTRLILSIAATGLAPGSFYARGEDGGRARSHFDGLPVDFVADAVSTIGLAMNDGYATYHVVNPHDDGVGLDEYVDWMIEAGCPIERIDDHADWFARFESALKNLPDRRRHASLLPIIDTHRHPLPPMLGTFAPTDRFRQAVAQHQLGVDGRIPGIEAANIVKYVSDLEVLGLLDPRPGA